jgi:hypothetical protein
VYGNELDVTAAVRHGRTILPHKEGVSRSPW